MTEVLMRCPVCSSEKFSLKDIIFDDRYGEPNIYYLAQCVVCKHLATYPRLNELDLPSLYGKYYPRKNISAEEVAFEASKVKKPFAKLLRWWNGTDNQGQYCIKPGQLMLDVGCGSGTSLLEAKSMGAQAFGIEADPNVQSIAQSLGLNIHFGSIHDQPFNQLTFDLIILNQVIEHLPDPDFALKILLERLRPTGRMILVFPNTNSLWRRIFGIKWINWHIPYHLHHFDIKKFEKLIKKCELEIIHSRTITPNVWTLMQLRAWFLKPQLGVPNSIWTVLNSTNNPKNVSYQTKKSRQYLRLIVFIFLGLTNRMIDALGMGDSILVELRKEK
jgi:SAM-dependent methyltransferase